MLNVWIEETWRFGCAFGLWWLVGLSDHHGYGEERGGRETLTVNDEWDFVWGLIALGF